jgi:hypothetical protein
LPIANCRLVIHWVIADWVIERFDCRDAALTQCLNPNRQCRNRQSLNESPNRQLAIGNGRGGPIGQ